MESTRESNSHTVPDMIHDAIFIAVIGGAATALFFLVLDSLYGTPYHTAEVLGASLLKGASITGVEKGAAALYSRFHIFAFALLGIALSFVIHEVELHARHPAVVMTAVVMLLFAGELFFMAAMMPGALAEIGVLPIFAANLIAGACIGAYLTAEHRPLRWQRLKHALHIA